MNAHGEQTSTARLPYAYVVTANRRTFDLSKLTDIGTSPFALIRGQQWSLKETYYAQLHRLSPYKHSIVNYVPSMIHPTIPHLLTYQISSNLVCCFVMLTKTRLGLLVLSWSSIHNWYSLPFVLYFVISFAGHTCLREQSPYWISILSRRFSWYARDIQQTSGRHPYEALTRVCKSSPDKCTNVLCLLDTPFRSEAFNIH